MVFPKECEGNSRNDQYHIFLNNVFVSFYTLHSISLTGMYYCYAIMFHLDINSTYLVHMWYLKNENLKNLFFKWIMKIIAFAFWDQTKNIQFSILNEKKLNTYYAPLPWTWLLKLRVDGWWGGGGGKSIPITNFHFRKNLNFVYNSRSCTLVHGCQRDIIVITERVRHFHDFI